MPAITSSETQCDLHTHQWLAVNMLLDMLTVHMMISVKRTGSGTHLTGMFVLSLIRSPGHVFMINPWSLLVTVNYSIIFIMLWLITTMKWQSKSKAKFLPRISEVLIFFHRCCDCLFKSLKQQANDCLVSVQIKIIWEQHWYSIFNSIWRSSYTHPIIQTKGASDLN